MVAPSTQLPPSSKTTLTKWNSRYAGHVPHDTSYYAKCVLGGILACGLTHTAMCPLDVTKCNMQVRDQIKSIDFSIIFVIDLG
jgi:hypothetical protein